MYVFGTIIAVIGGLLVIAILVEAWMKRGRYRPLTAGIDFERKVEHKRELGTEAIDFDVVNKTIRDNNASGLSNSTREVSQYLRYTNVQPKGLKDDEHYARRWLETYGPHDKGTKK